MTGDLDELCPPKIVNSELLDWLDTMAVSTMESVHAINNQNKRKGHKCLALLFSLSDKPPRFTRLVVSYTQCG